MSKYIVTLWHVVPSGDCVSPTPRAPSILALACEWYNLSMMWLPQSVIDTIQSTTALSTRYLYDFKWRVFKEWFNKERNFSFHCPVGTILTFLQGLINKHKAYSMIKVFFAAISACKAGFKSKTLCQYPLDCCCIKKKCRFLSPVHYNSLETWPHSCRGFQVLSLCPWNTLIWDTCPWRQCCSWN